MSAQQRVAGAIVVVALGVGVALAAKATVSPGLYVGADPKTAAANLLALARRQAGKGSWQRLRVARVAMLGGQSALAKEIIADVEGGKTEPSDWIRIARIHLEAGNWDAAAPYLARVLTAKPNDEDWLAEIGAWYNLHGGRAKAEELFRRSFELDPENHRNSAVIAGSYIEVKPPVDI